MKAISYAFLIATALIVMRVRIKYLPLSKVIKLENKILLIKLYERFLNFDEMLHLLNFFYRKKHFTCLECAIFLRHFQNNIRNLSLHIGVKGSGSDFESHAWVCDSKGIIFGDSQHSKKFNSIHFV